MKKKILVDQAVGMVLPHDVTEIVRGEKKGPAFRKGHVIRQEDLPHLKRLGKEHIYVLELRDDEIHEDEAARILSASLAGSGIECSPEPVEGKISLIAEENGLLKIDVDSLYQFNLLGEVMCATLPNYTPVHKGDTVAATRLIPLIAKRKLLDQATAICKQNKKIIQVIALKKVRAGVVITGNEVFSGKIEDRFQEVIRTKLKELGSQLDIVRYAPDDIDKIATAIKDCITQGAQLIITTGGMSVDPDDVTRKGIFQAGAEEITYGSPVLPGAMFLTGRIKDVPILGLPACGMYHKITVFDLVLPRILIGEKVGREQLAALGHGGLCRNCKKCRYPVCHFGP
ncbi:MAG: molybdopterin-binding protein [Desulfobulbaceae bacterium]|nr:molybdopterin-binding protein [Desulfobulbaceae bacterium]